MTSNPTVSAVICTRNRGTKIAATLSALLTNDHPGFEVVVIDQSTNDITAQAVAGFADPRLVYRRSDTVGTGRSRAIGMATARADLILYTDDDCLPSTDWVAEMVRPFENDPRVGVVFCAVTPLIDDDEAGFTPSFEFDGDSVITSLWRYAYRYGMGAGMGVRRSAMEEIGGFDTRMGPGSPFMSGEDADIAVRAVIGGWKVYNTSQTTVIHDGLRRWDEFPELAKRDWFSLGGVYAKPLRRGVPAAYWLTAFQLIYRCVIEPLRKTRWGRRPRGLKRLPFMLQGLAAGLRHPLAPEHLVYQAEEPSRA